MLLSSTLFAHSFGERYELPISLSLFLLGGAAVVFLTFLFILSKKSNHVEKGDVHEKVAVKPVSKPWAIVSFLLLGIFAVIGTYGSPVVTENIVPTLFWLGIWIFVPITCGIIGNWTQRLNPYVAIAQLADDKELRKSVLARTEPLEWPKKLGWWPAVILLFLITSGELIFNYIVILPAFTAMIFAFYLIVSGFFGMLFGKTWIERGEVFHILFSTWGKLGYFRFGAEGKKGFAGGLLVPFDASISRIAFVMLMLVSVNFDSIMSTPYWRSFQLQLPQEMVEGTFMNMILATVVFAALAVVMWLIFTLFAYAVTRIGKHGGGFKTALAGILPSLLPISFGYLVAHNIQYLLINGQLMFPLIGNPAGLETWPIKLPYPFTSDYAIVEQVLPSGFFWYFSVAVIVFAHVIAVIVAHHYLGAKAKSAERARRSEYPWIVVMIAYTMFSLWLLSQPLVESSNPVDQVYSSNAARNHEVS